jgi:hypothetical protein
MVDTPDSLAADMLKAAAEAGLATRAVVQRGALNIKNDARNNVLATAPVQNAHAHAAIGYDTTRLAATIRGVIGYDKDRPGGALGNILEYGSRHNPPHRDLGRALDKETPEFERQLAEVIGRLL